MSELVPEIIEGEVLSVAEGKRLAELEAIIEENFSGFVAVGFAMAEIRDRGLYREKCKTFEEYCQTFWDVNKSYAYRLINSANVVENISRLSGLSPIGDKPMSTIVDNKKHIPLPTNEAQARELAKLPPEEQVEVWQHLVNETKESGGKITAKDVKKAVLKHRGEAVDKQIEKAKQQIRENRTDFQSEEFTEAFDRFFDQIRIEREANWRYTSRKTVHNVLLGLVEVVAEAVPGTMDEYGCAMELADREKLKKAGFRIFSMDAKKRLIEEYHHGDTWVIYAECSSPKQLNDTFKQLLEDHMHLKG